MTKQIIRTYLRFSLLMALAHSFFYATYQLFLVSHGLSLMQINLINLFFMASNFILQVPTGAFADIFGRRRSVTLGCFITALSFLIYYFSDSFMAFALAEMVGALGMTFVSGALEAWMVDSLKFHDYDGSLEKVYEREGGFSTVGVIVSSLIGAAAGSYDIALPWLMTAIGVGLVGIYAWFNLKETYFQKPEGQEMKASFKQIKETSLVGMRYGLRHKSVLYAISFGSLLALCFQGFNMQWPLAFKNYGLSVWELGLVFNGIAIMSYLGNKLSGSVSKLFPKEKDALVFGQVITAVGMIIASSMIGLLPVLSGFMIHELGRGTFRPLKQAYLNRRLEADKRATVLSFDSMIGQLGSAVGLLLSGYLADAYSIGTSWLTSGIILSVAIVVFRSLKNGD